MKTAAFAQNRAQPAAKAREQGRDGKKTLIKSRLMPLAADAATTQPPILAPDLTIAYIKYGALQLAVSSAQTPAVISRDPEQSRQGRGQPQKGA